VQQHGDNDLSLYYKVFNRYKPEVGESNAESVARTTALEAEYNYLLMKQRTKTNKVNKNKKPIETEHSLSPSTPPSQTAIFNRVKDKASLYQNNVQEIPLDTDYYLYHTPEQTIKSQPLNIIYDTGAAISMLPADYTHAWTNLRPCLHTLTGCFSGQSESNLMIGEFHGIITLDLQETIRVIIPECIQIPQGLSNTYLLSDSAFLMAGHTYVSHLSKPKLRLKGGGTYTMSVTRGHKLITVMPTNAEEDTTHRTVYLHSNEPYDPPTFVNNVLYQCTNRPNAHTPTAFTWHLRYGCKCAKVLQNTQQHVNGLQIRQGTIKELGKLLPCSACLAGKMRKLNRHPTKPYTDITNLVSSTNNSPLSWSPSTADKIVSPNHTISVDWGIINKKAKTNVKNVFALFLDTITGNVFSYAAESRGGAGPALQAYIQQYGKPHKLIHDNAQEFLHGDFNEICKLQSIQQVPSPPYESNKNPVELYMGILTGMMRSLLFISGLNPDSIGKTH
jgi:hypothetical protein